MQVMSEREPTLDDVVAPPKWIGGAVEGLSAKARLDDRIAEPEAGQR
jgi:hypothetical protein